MLLEEVENLDIEDRERDRKDRILGLLIDIQFYNE